MNLISGLIDRTSSSQAKIALFRSLFRGREDVYPRRFESRKTGKAGYAHLSGSDETGQGFVAGVYPLLQDETCCFLVVDFDKAGLELSFQGELRPDQKPAAEAMG